MNVTHIRNKNRNQHTATDHIRVPQRVIKDHRRVQWRTRVTSSERGGRQRCFYSFLFIHFHFSTMMLFSDCLCVFLSAVCSSDGPWCWWFVSRVALPELSERKWQKIRRGKNVLFHNSKYFCTSSHFSHSGCTFCLLSSAITRRQQSFPEAEKCWFYFVTPICFPDFSSSSSLSFLSSALFLVFFFS